MSDYQSLPGFEGVYLEESIVKMVAATPTALTIAFEAYLLRDHPLWHEPHEGEAWTWIPAVMSFTSVTRTHWVGGERPPSRNADGTTDYDEFYSFTRDGDDYEIDCGAGTISVTAGSLTLTLHPEAEVTS